MLRCTMTCLLTINTFLLAQGTLHKMTLLDIITSVNNLECPLHYFSYLQESEERKRGSMVGKLCVFFIWRLLAPPYQLMIH